MTTTMPKSGSMHYPHDQIRSTGTSLSGHADSLRSIASSASGNGMAGNSLGSIGSGTANAIHGHLQQVPGHVSHMADTEDGHGQRLRRNSVDMQDADQLHAGKLQDIGSSMRSPASGPSGAAGSSAGTKRPHDGSDEEPDADARPNKRPVRTNRYTGNYNEGGSHGGGGGLPSNHPDFPRKSYGTWTQNTKNERPTGNQKGDEANWQDRRHIIPYNHMATTMQKWVDTNYPHGDAAAEQARRQKIEELGGVLKNSNNNVNNLWLGRGDHNQAIGGIATNLHHNQQSVANEGLSGQDAYDKANRWSAAGSHLRPGTQGEMAQPYMRPLVDEPRLAGDPNATNHYLNDVHDSAHFDWPTPAGNAGQHFQQWQESYDQMSRIQNNPGHYSQEDLKWTFNRFNGLPDPTK